MPLITIRGVPQSTRDAPAARAARSGRSLQEYLRLALIGLGDRPDPEELASRIRARKDRTGVEVPSRRFSGIWI